MAANPERGEVDLVIGDEKGVLCAEMARLAILSSQIGTRTMRDLFERLQGVEPFAMYAAIDALLVDGDPKAIKQAMRTPGDLAIVSAAVIKSLGAFVEDSPKNG